MLDENTQRNTDRMQAQIHMLIKIDPMIDDHENSDDDKQDHLRWRYSTVIQLEQLVYLGIYGKI